MSSDQRENPMSSALDAPAPSGSDRREARPGGRLSSLRAHRLAPLGCAILALVPILAICLVQPPVYSMLIDECVQELYARGDFLATASGMLMPYSLAPVSVPLGLLYAALPQVPWYPLMLLALTEVGFAIAYTAALRSRASDPVCASFMAVLVACEVISLFYFTYTIVAFLAVASGLMLLLARAAFDRPGRPRPSDVAGLLLVFFGYALRPESGQAAFVLFAPFAVYVLVCNRNAGSIVRGALAVLCVVLATAVGQVAYDATPGWEGFTAFLDAGRSSLDYPDLDAVQIQEILPELSENDAEMLNDWMFTDEGVYPTTLFERYSAARPHYSLGYLVNSFAAKTTYAMFALVAAMGVVAWITMRDLRAPQRIWVLAFGIIAMLLASCILLIMRERVRPHVIIPLVITTIMALITCAGAPAEAAGHFKRAPGGVFRGKLAAAFPAAVCVVAAVACAGFWWIQVRPEQAKLTAPTVTATRAYIEEHPDQLIVMNRSQNILYYGAGNVFDLERWEFPENVLTIGGWERETGPWKDFLARWDLSADATLTDMVDRPDAVMIVQDYDLPQVELYLSEHTGETVTSEVLEDLGPGLRATDRRIVAVRFVSS